MANLSCREIGLISGGKLPRKVVGVARSFRCACRCVIRHAADGTQYRVHDLRNRAGAFAAMASVIEDGHTEAGSTYRGESRGIHAIQHYRT